MRGAFYKKSKFNTRTLSSHIDSKSFFLYNRHYKDFVLAIPLKEGNTIGTALNNKLNLLLSGMMDSAVFFPIVNGGPLLLTTLSSFLIFKEKPTLRKCVGILPGILSVLLLCNPFG